MLITFRKIIFSGLLLAMISSVQLAVVHAAQPPEEGGQSYIVQADDWLSKLADKFYGDPLAYLVIVDATNVKAAADSTYAKIVNPDVIEIGQRLFIPEAAELSSAQIAVVNPEQVAEAVTVVEDPTEDQLQLLASMDVIGTPPELFNEVWLNSNQLKLADLRGKVVIVEFWTYG